jgi:maleylpyruvate isomerase
MTTPPVLYSYFRSSAAWRVRIALGLKGLAYTTHPVHLLRGGGQQQGELYRALNPQGLVPTLVDGPDALTQSLAIVEYLEERHPEPPLLPRDPWGRAQVRAMALAVACDIHPLNNLRVLRYLRHELGQDDEGVARWYRHWVEEGLAALEALVARAPGRGDFCWGDRPGLADLCLVPQLANARRHDADLDGVPTLLAIEANCLELPAFAKAAPARQPDAE